MIPRVLLGSTTIPDTRTEMRLYQHGETFSIKIPGRGELMNSWVHGSEKALAELACERLGPRDKPRVLLGGLGMGFTLAAALQALNAQAEVWVAELVADVVDWNHQYLGALSGHPLKDPRSRVFISDVAELIRKEVAGFDAILLDVDNGPEALIRRENDWLYSLAGLQAARQALRPEGVLAIWSAGPDRPFVKQLEKAGFTVEDVMVRAHRKGKGSRHHIWLAS